eukprot:CAMPEP_0174749296 /NCGR_PEP_ID=MMETSP1094-20130205/95372_1 /TAXON_ID=156173 /ORGANISM="Chrysochromulina brevifilum, Strain UTEX LB 985" /LENGTH=195 /DNA_ID=CAMNT_0015954481 /DNA_START=1 /DNA_END=588 /DNA_ORIENTATION=+
MSRWTPDNGICLAWPSAAKLVDSSAPPLSEFGTSTLLDHLEEALNRTLQPNLWPSMPKNGGGVEQVGATQAVNDLLLKSVGGKLTFFPGWEPGQAVSFQRLRAPGAFLVSASRDAAGTLQPISLLSEAGALCRLKARDAADAAGRGAQAGMAPLVAAEPLVTTAAGATVRVECSRDQCWFNTTRGMTYHIMYTKE